MDREGSTAKYYAPELYDEELRIVRENPYGSAVAAAFELAGIEYGRADFGLVDSKVQLYEINSNPHDFHGVPNPWERTSMTSCQSLWD